MNSSEQVILKVDGMTCVNCARSVENAVEENGGKNIAVNLADKEVVFENVGSADLQLIKDTITKRGYTVLEEASNQDKKKS